MTSASRIGAVRECAPDAAVCETDRAADALFAFSAERCGELARRHGTPSFVYDVQRAEAAWQELRAALPERVALAYAVKANPHAVLLSRLAALGARFDCASEGELRRAAAALQGAPPGATPGAKPGAKPGNAPRSTDVAGPAGNSGAGAGATGRLLFAGPGKRDAELALAFALDARVQAEGWEDLSRLDALAAGAGRTIAVNLRVHPLRAATEARPILGGSGPSAFGVDEEDLPALLARARALRSVRIAGLHVFSASNQRDAQALLDAHGAVLELARTLHVTHGIALEQIDLGGGLGVPYAPHEAPLDVTSLGRGLRTLLEEHAWYSGELLLEPGRYIAAWCGVYLVRVVRTKRSRGVRFAMLEGGINHLLRPLLTGQPFPVRRVGCASGVAGTLSATAGTAEGAVEVAAHVALQAATFPTRLAGPLCTALDRLGDVPLPELQPGDLLAFGMTGAYGATEAMGEFLSHPHPPEIWV